MPAPSVPGGTCTITQSVTATSTNSNTTGTPTATGPVALTALTANATLTVAAVAPTITKAFAVGAWHQAHHNLTVTIGNTNGGRHCPQPAPSPIPSRPA